MEFCRKMLYLYENMWKMKDATINLPILIEEYACTSWGEAKKMKNEPTYYHFGQEQVAKHYDLDGRIQLFYQRAFRNPITYEHQSLGDKERYRNKREEKQI